MPIKETSYLEKQGIEDSTDIDWPEKKPTFWRALARANELFQLTTLYNDGFDVILLYHSVGGIPGANYAYDLPEGEFRRQIQFISDEYTAIDLGKVPLQSCQQDGKRVAITFDDGFRNVYENAVPILREFEIPATIFVCPEFLDDRNSDRIKQCHSLPSTAEEIIMTEEQTRELAADELFTIGNHTASHARLVELGRNEIAKEIVGGKEKLEEKLGKPIDRFSYPYGTHDSKISKIVRDEHKLAVCSERSPVGSNPNPFKLPRIDACQPFTTLRFDMTDVSYYLRQAAKWAVDLDS